MQSPAKKIHFLLALAVGLTLPIQAPAEAPAPMASTASSKTILFLGDSLTEGYGIQKSQAFPAQFGALVKERLGRDVTVINGGVSGSTTASGLERLEWYLKRKPDILVLALGANDGLRGVAVEASKQNLLAIVDRAREAGLDVVLAGMYLPPNYGPDYTKQFREMFESIHKERQVKFIPFILEGVAGVKELNLPDGIHPNPAGHRIMAETVFNRIKDLL